MTEMPPYLAVNDEEKNSGQGDSDNSATNDDWDLPLCFDKPRHLEPIKGAERVEHTWRVKEKYKTHCVALVLCLNVGVDPPDVVKTQPCARLECWIDPLSLSPSKALESIGHALQTQYERWQPRARYKQSLDPTSDEVKKLCCSLRRNAKDERVLFHYNGHGVPKPTAQGEIWVFNRAYTQYIPLSMYDLQTWMGAPSLYVYDCSNAGVIVDNFRQFAEQHERENEAQAAKAESVGAGAGAAPASVSYKNCIQLGACAAGQSLPMNPELPADLFTACLTTPVKMAMKWFVLRSKTRVAPADVHDLIDKIPGQVTDRRTMLGELNWIFTAITDTIAWSSLPPDLFQQLFRADLLTASLCRNFLLADRIMRSYNCTPVCTPALPSLARHPLWAAWDHALDLALAQLPALLLPAPAAPAAPAALVAAPALYAHSPFFRDQLTAFQVWLDLGKWRGSRAPPEQLPMVLQVLLSTLHRVRALRLLCRFLALGAWAARAVLAVGIFPYMLKLLQASAPDLRHSMVYIWAKIVAVDPSCQVDLVNAKGHKYFLAVLQDPTVDSEHRTLAAYVLAGIVDNYPAGQEAALQGSMISICLEQVCDGWWRLAQWACVALGRLWRGFDAARWAGVRDLAHEKLYPLLAHPHPEVRAACAFALGAFVAAGGLGARSEHANVLDQQVAVTLAAGLRADASVLVRHQILAALQWLVLIFEQHFIAVYIQERVRKSDKAGSPRAGGDVEHGTDVLTDSPRAAAAAAHAGGRGAALALPSIGFGSVYMKLWAALTAMAREPHPQIAQCAGDIINYVANQVDSVGRELELSRGSASLPPSPNTRPAPAAPHAHHARTLPAGRRGKSGLPHTISEDSVASRERERDRDLAPGARDREKERDSTSSNSSQPLKKPIVSTQFVEWAAAQFSAPEGGGGGGGGALGEGGGADCEARPAHQRAWRRARNASLRREAAGAAARRARGAAGDAGLPLPLPAAAHRRALPPLRAARRRRLQGQLRHLRLGHGGEAVHGQLAEGVGPHHGAGVPQRARPRAAGRRLAHRQPRHIQAGGQQRGAGAGGGVARAGRAARRRLPPAARPGRLHGERGGRRGRGGRVLAAAAGRAAALVRAPPHAGAGRPRRRRAPVGRRHRDAARRHTHRVRVCGDVAVARRRVGRRRAAAVRVRRRVAARVGRALRAPAAVRAAAPRRARAGRRAPPRPLHHDHRLHGRRGAHLRHAQAGAAGGAGDAARARAARRARRAPALRPARLRLREPEHQRVRPEGRAAADHQVPRGVHGGAHRARLLPHLPPAQVRDGRGLQGLDGVGVRVGGAPVTLAVQPGAAAAAAQAPLNAPHADTGSCGSHWYVLAYTEPSRTDHMIQLALCSRHDLHHPRSGGLARTRPLQSVDGAA